jgi:hypothetical protein
MEIKKLEPDTRIKGLEETKVSDFWSWAYSDVMSNTTRAIFAEFIVANALDKTNKVRIEWDETDIRYRRKKIEVKSAAYTQRWKQEKPSVIRFDISKKYGWNAETNEYPDMPV